MTRGFVSAMYAPIRRVVGVSAEDSRVAEEGVVEATQPYYSLLACADSR